LPFATAAATFVAVISGIILSQTESASEGIQALVEVISD
jgi:hypothetical protein